MIEKKVEICIGTDRAKNMRVRLSLIVVDDGKVMSEQYHSCAVDAGTDLEALRAAVEAHIAMPDGGVPGAPWPAIPDAEWAEVLAHRAILHTPARVAKWRNDRAEEAAAEAAIARVEKAKEKAKAEAAAVELAEQAARKELVRASEDALIEAAAKLKAEQHAARAEEKEKP